MFENLATQIKCVARFFISTTLPYSLRFKFMSRVFLIVLISAFLWTCKSSKAIKTGENAFALKRYELATRLLKEEYRKANDKSTKAHKAFLIAESFKRFGNVGQAKDWFKTAADLDYGEDALFSYAYSLKMMEEYESAIKVFRVLEQKYPSVQRYKQEVLSCQNAQNLKTRHKNSSAELKFLSLNTPYNDFHPRWLNEMEIVFVSDRNLSDNAEERRYGWTGQGYTDLFVYNFISGKVKIHDGGVNTEYNEGILTSDTLEEQQIFTRCTSDSESSDSYCKLYRMGNRYGGEELLNFVKEGYNYMHPSISEDGNILVFAAQLPGGEGNYDLWVSERDSRQDIWRDPQPLSSRINTPGDELFPSLHGDTLYFSSNYINGMGGQDIYMSYLMNDHTWAPPIHFPPPLNSGYDDFSFIPDTHFAKNNEIETAGFFSSNRPSEAAGDNIFHYSIKKPLDTDNQEDEEDHRIVLELIVRADSSKGNVKEKPKYFPLEGASVEFTTEGVDTIISTDEKGMIRMEIEAPKAYELLAKNSGFLSKGKRIKAGQYSRIERRKTSIYRDAITLDLILAGEEIVLEDIYYDYDEYYIREDAKPALDSLTQILKHNPDIAIQLASHTDCRGDLDYNNTLSYKRAEAAVTYIISKGIDKGRLSAKGFGETRPRDNCACETCSEEQHQRNRRTTFTILE